MRMAGAPPGKGKQRGAQGSLSLLALSFLAGATLTYLVLALGGQQQQAGAGQQAAAGGSGRQELLEQGDAAAADSWFEQAVATLAGASDGGLLDDGADSPAAAVGCPPADESAAAGRRRRMTSTLVVYVYSAADEEEQRNFHFFLQRGIQPDDGVAYRVVLTQGPGVLELPSLPPLPLNAEYLAGPACPSTFGVLGGVMQQLPLSGMEYLVVVDSSVKGPFLAPYAQQALHWAEALTSRLGGQVRLVGSAISCEGAPKGGDAAAEWREIPYVLPYAWATDQAGLALLQAAPEVLSCHTSPWDARYHSDAGASAAVLGAGQGIDCLLAKYQGVDWGDASTWGCNQRVRPDFELSYDGASLSPFEALFVPLGAAARQAGRGAAKLALKLEEWAGQQPAAAALSNEWATNPWGVRGERLLAANARGPGCFDFAAYTAGSPDLAPLARNPMALWEHFLVLGQFQGRPHSWKCPLRVGNSYRMAYERARGARCFDPDAYATHHTDLGKAGLKTADQLFKHWLQYGQFEGRSSRFVCSDTLVGLPAGFDFNASADSVAAQPGTASAALPPPAAAGSRSVQQQQQEQQQPQAAGQQAEQVAEDSGEDAAAFARIQGSAAELFFRTQAKAAAAAAAAKAAKKVAAASAGAQQQQ